MSSELNMKSLRSKGCSWDAVRIPDQCRGCDIVIGIDEAGRGPVLGSLVYTAAFWPQSLDEEISALGFNDSKQLKEEDRDRLLEKMINHPAIGWVIEEIDAVTISEKMLQASPISLNTISYDAVIRCLQTIGRASPVPPNITNIYIDTVGDPETYKKCLTRALGDDFGNFIIEKKADATYKTVSAASIIAKVTRDRLLREWQWVETGLSLDKTFGSGYPGDEVCQQWLQRAKHPLFGFPNLVRFSWSTVKDILGETQREGSKSTNSNSSSTSAVKVKWECEEEEDVIANETMKSFFSANDNASRLNTVTTKRTRSTFFRRRKIRRLGWNDID